MLVCLLLVLLMLFVGVLFLTLFLILLALISHSVPLFPLSLIFCGEGMRASSCRQYFTRPRRPNIEYLTIANNKHVPDIGEVEDLLLLQPPEFAPLLTRVFFLTGTRLTHPATDH